MKVRSWIPILLGFTAFGCGVNHKMLDPAATSASVRDAAVADHAHRTWSSGMVYTMTNATGGNAVLAYPRAGNGTLGAAQSYPTGGTGSGASLSNQGALAMDDEGRWLFVVNAGSNDVSAFRVTGPGLNLTGRAATGGDHPVSVTAHEDLVYVLNAGGTGGIQGFRLAPNGSLKPIAGSQRPLSSTSAGAAEIAFTPEGDALVVTEKATNKISVYRVGPNGVATGPVVYPSAGTTPYGFGFDPSGTLVVSEAFGGATNGSAVSSYRLGHGGSLSTVSASVPTNQTAACWIAVPREGRFAYTANAGSASVTGYAIGAGGSLTRLAGDATTTAAGPTDMCFGGRYLYVLSSHAGAISGFAPDEQGALSSLGPVTSVPMGANGLVAR